MFVVLLLQLCLSLLLLIIKDLNDCKSKNYIHRLTFTIEQKIFEYLKKNNLIYEISPTSTKPSPTYPLKFSSLEKKKSNKGDRLLLIFKDVCTVQDGIDCLKIL